MIYIYKGKKYFGGEDILEENRRYIGGEDILEEYKKI